ncbi:MAG: LysE family transporter [Clostridia bacterium]|nr:LysE family transporter [Clostridia bacterium]
MYVFLQGLLIGVAYVAPIGVQNLFVIESALTLPRRRALATALIVTFFDITLSLACFFGVGAVMERLRWLQWLLLGAGSLFILYMGLRLILSKESADGSGREVDISLPRTAATACAVTWFNPQAIIDGTVLLGAFRAQLAAADGTRFILGAACASLLWFSLVTLIISLLGSRISSRVMLWINRVCGAVMVFYGVRLLGSFIKTL